MDSWRASVGFPTRSASAPETDSDGAGRDRGHERNARGASVLLPLQPHGVGGAEVESILSYSRRLADAHVIDVAYLVRKIVLEPLQAQRGQRAMLFNPSTATESICGTGRVPEAYVARLTGLTLQPHLTRCTFLGVDGIAFDRHWRRERAWCPECLDVGEPYDRLAWAVDTYTVCVPHGRRLRSACSQCGRSHRPLALRATATACPHCGAPLSGGRGALVTADSFSQLTYALVERHEAGAVLSREMVTGAVRGAAAPGRRKELARRANVPPSSVSTYAVGRGRPELGILLKLLLASGLDVAVFFSRAPVEVLPPKRGSMSNAVAARAQLALEVALRAEDHELLALRKVAGRVGQSSDTLRRRFPALCGELVERRRRHGARERARKEAELEELVRATVRRLAASHEHVVRRMVEKALPKSGVFRSPRLKAVATEEMERIGR